MIRDYSQETVALVNDELATMLAEVEQQEEYLDIPMDEDLAVYEAYVRLMKKEQQRINEQVYEANCQWDVELKKVHEIEERYAGKLQGIKELLQLYDQGLRGVAEMFQIEKLTMEPSVYQTQIQSFRMPYYEKKAELNLLEQYLTREQLDNLLALGYTSQQIQGLYRNFNEADIEFFGYLAEGTQESYTKAFMLDPTTLTDEMGMIMADYACRVFRMNPEDCTQLEMFNNAMLAVNFTVDNDILDKIGFGETYRECYFQMLCSNTEVLLMRDTVALAEMPPKSEEYQILSEQHFSELALLNLWMAEAATMDAFAEEKRGSDFYYVRTSQMSYDGNGCFSFDMYNGLTPYCEESEMVKSVETMLFMTPDALAISIDIDRCNDIRRELDGYLDREFGQLALGKIIDACMDLAPDVVANAYDMLKENAEYNKILQGYMELEHALMAAEDDGFASIFGIGGGCTIDGEEYLCHHGIYDPEIYRRMQAIEEEGLAAVMGWNEETLEEKKKLITPQETEEDIEEVKQKMKGLIEALLFGGFSFEEMAYTNAAGDRIVVTMTELLTAIRNLGAEDCAKYEDEQ